MTTEEEMQELRLRLDRLSVRVSVLNKAMGLQGKAIRELSQALRLLVDSLK